MDIGLYQSYYRENFSEGYTSCRPMPIPPPSTTTTSEAHLSTPASSSDSSLRGSALTNTSDEQVFANILTNFSEAPMFWLWGVQWVAAQCICVKRALIYR